MKKSMLIDSEFFPPFAGFPKEGLRFLSRLKRNNNREWFTKHKEEYEQNVRFPMQCLVASLAQRMASDAEEIEFNSRKSIFRIHRDVRFSKNKSPYKTSIAAVFRMRGGREPGETPGLYVGVEPGEVFVGGGVYLPTGDQLKAFRRAIVESPELFLAVIENQRFKRQFGGISGERLQKGPLGFPKVHPMIEHLKHKQFYVGKVYEDSVCLKPRFLEAVASVFTDAMPLVRWLARVAWG